MALRYFAHNVNLYNSIFMIYCLKFSLQISTQAEIKYVQVCAHDQAWPRTVLGGMRGSQSISLVTAWNLVLLYVRISVRDVIKWPAARRMQRVI